MIKTENDITEMIRILQEEFDVGEKAARAMTVHWNLLAGKRFFETEDNVIITETERFLANLSVDAAVAEKKIKRQKKSAERMNVKKTQLNIFSDDNESPDFNP